MFLTTQYLEEADQLAARVGIIDGGKIVAEGTPAELKAQVGDPRLELTLARAEDLERATRALARYGEPLPSRDGHLSLRLPEGAAALTSVVRSLDEAGVEAAGLELALPSLDDVFVAKTGRRLEAEGAEEPRRRARRSVRLAAVQTAALARRAFVNTLRTPQALFPSLFFPLVLMAIFTGSFGAAPGRLPGFPPVRGFLDFAVAGAILQGILIGGTTAGAAFALDIEGGFFDRLVASPVSRVAILTGRLVGGVMLAMIQTVLFLSIGLAFGARVQGGVAGVLLLLLLAALLSVAVSGLGVTLALRSGSSEAVQGSFPLVFALLFFSSAFFPRETMTGWFRAVADVNPVSYLVEAMRDQVIFGVQARATLIGFGVVLLLVAVALAASYRAFLNRLAGSS